MNRIQWTSPDEPGSIEVKAKFYRNGGSNHSGDSKANNITL